MAELREEQLPLTHVPSFGETGKEIAAVHLEPLQQISADRLDEQGDDDSSDDFEFTFAVRNPMGEAFIAADEMFSNGRILPYTFKIVGLPRPLAAALALEGEAEEAGAPLVNEELGGDGELEEEGRGTAGLCWTQKATRPRRWPKMVPTMTDLEGDDGRRLAASMRLSSS